MNKYIRIIFLLFKCKQVNTKILHVKKNIELIYFIPNENIRYCHIYLFYRNEYQKSSQELVTISNETDQCKFIPINYYVRDAYRTRNLNIRSESRRNQVDEKEQERRVWSRIDNSRRVKFTRSESLPDINRERVRNTREREVDFRGTDRRVLERNTRRFLENRIDKMNFRREVRDIRVERQTNRDDNIDLRRRTAYIREVFKCSYILMN